MSLARFDLDQDRYSAAIEKEVIKRPPSCAVLALWYGKLATNHEQTVLAVDAQDKFYVNSILVPRAEMADRVKLALEEKTERVVLIKGDTDASYRAIMAAMDDLRKAGIEDIGLNTDPKVDPNNPQQPPVGGK